VSTRITIEISRVRESSAAVDLCAVLERETGLLWRESPAPDSDTDLGGLTLILTAVMTGAAEQTAELAIAEARKVLHEWRARHLDPPQARLTVKDTAAGEQADAPPDEA
jgi:hypothetical protein